MKQKERQNQRLFTTTKKKICFGHEKQHQFSQCKTEIEIKKISKEQ